MNRPPPGPADRDPAWHSLIHPRMKTIPSLLLSALLCGLSSVSGQVPQLINHQGRIAVNGANFNGTGQFKFRLLNNAGTAIYWSNDGTVGDEPASAVPLPVTKGLYSVGLGDTTLSGMTTPITPAVFAASDVRLRVWFNDGVLGFQQLVPDQRIGAVGYALVAATVQAGGVTADQIAPGAVSSVHIAAGGIQASNLAADVLAGGGGTVADGSITTAKLADGAVTSAKLAGGAVGAAQLNPGGLATTLWLAAGNTGTAPGAHFLGTTDNQPLEVKVNGSRALRLEPTTSGAPNVLAGSPRNEISAGVVGATIGGGGAVSHSGTAITNKIQSNFGVISGGGGNGILAAADYASIGGGYLNVISNSALYGVVGGGYANAVGSNAATVAGGFLNLASGFESAVGGGEGNVANGTASFVGGGVTNVAGGFESVVGGGERNGAFGTNNFIGGGYLNGTTNLAAAIAGGYGNYASGTASFIGGGVTNIAAGFESVVAGGELNDALGALSVVGGGYYNAATNYAATIGGGNANFASGAAATVAGGDQNVASGGVAFVGGGYFNGATGFASAVPGGYANAATGSNSWAGGYFAHAAHPGAFVWSDSVATNVFASTANHQFAVRATGGARFVSNVAGNSGVQLPAGGGAWQSLSDRHAKDNFREVNPREVLEQVAAMPVTTWNYRSQAAGIRHIGPMAQDFHAAFGVGEDERHITSTDADGVALAAIQGLYAIVKKKDARITALEQRLAELEARLGNPAK